MRRRLAMSGLLASFVLVSASTARALTVNVPGDYATIQSAIDDPAVTVIQVSPGHYPENLRVHRQVTLEAAPTSAPFTFASYPSAQSLTVETTRFTCTGMRFRGPAVQTSYSSSPVGVEYTTCRFDSGFAAILSNAGAMRLTGCVVFGACRVGGSRVDVAGGLFIGGGLEVRSEGVLTVADNHIQGPAEIGLRVRTLDVGGTVSGNTVSACVEGIRLESEGADNPWFLSNRVHDCSGAGIGLASSHQYRVSLSGNEVLRCGGAGIESNSSLAMLDATANLIDSVGADGIRVPNSVSLTLQQNIVRRAGAAGIYVGTIQDTSAAIRDNVVLGCSGVGIRTTRGHVEGNVVGRSGSHGIFVDGGSLSIAPRIRGNTVYRNLGSAIAVNLASANSVDHNIGYLNQRYGVEVVGGVAPTLGCNDWYGNWSGAALGVPVAPTDLAVEPQFCDWPHDDVSLSATSPLLAPANGCGLIGARPQGCTVPSLVEAEPPGSVEPQDALGVTPLPSTGRIEFRWRPFERAARLEVFDAAGARRWSRPVARGEAAVTWDGVDDTGKALPAGVYFAKLSPPRGEIRTRVVLAR